MENQRDGLQNKLTDGKTAGKIEAFSNLARSTCNMHCRDHFFLKCAHGLSIYCFTVIQQSMKSRFNTATKT